VDFLIGTFPTEPTATLEVSISSDGEENMSDGECFGPPSQTGCKCAGSAMCPDSNPGEPFESGSWQDKVCARVQNSAVILAKYWGPSEILAAEDETDQETGLLRGPGVSDLTFFEAIVQSTGGKLIVIPDDDPVPSGPSIFGVIGACCLQTGLCRDDVTEAECASLSGTHQGESSTCDGLAEPCADVIPATSDWGVIVLTLTILAGATAMLRWRTRGRTPSWPIA